MIGLKTLVLNRAPALVPRSMPIPMGGGAGSSSIEAQLRAYGSVGVLFAIVSSLAESTASATWALYAKGGDEPVENHPAAQLWAKPNPYQDHADFVETFQQHFDLTGETDWYVGRSSAFSTKIPLELWPIRPDRLMPVADPDKFLTGWVFKSGKGDVPWLVDDVIQMKRPNPWDPYRGLGAVAAAMVDVYGEKAAAEYNAAFFANSAEPGGVIQFPERLPDEEYEEFVKRWREQHQGVQNAHRVAILEGAEWKERRYTMRDMQFEALRKLNREFIRQAFRYPKSMLGDAEDVNKATARAGQYIFDSSMVKTRLDRIKSVLNGKLLPMFGSSAEGLEFRYETPVPEDEEMEIAKLNGQATRVKTLVEAGFDPDEVLKWAGLPPMKHTAPSKAAPGGDDDEPNRGGRPRTEDDPGARDIWLEGEKRRRENPRLTNEQIAGLLGVSERTYRRYREIFEVSAS